MLVVSISSLQAKEEFSVYVDQEDKNITLLSQLMPTNSKQYFDAGYYLPIEVSYVNYTNKVQHLRIGGTCYTLNPWEVKGDLRFIRKHSNCLKRIHSRLITLQPKEKLNKTLELLFPKKYLKKRVSFKVGFKEVIGKHFDGYKHVATYWSETIIINETAEDISKSKMK